MRMGVSSTFSRWLLVGAVGGFGCILVSGYFWDLPLIGVGIGGALVLLGVYGGYRLSRIKESIELTPDGFQIRVDGCEFYVDWGSVEDVARSDLPSGWMSYLVIKTRTPEGVVEHVVGLNLLSCLNAESALRRYLKHPELRGKLAKR